MDEMMYPTVSVAIPAYNAEKYIYQTLDSVVRQSYKGVIETVITDDCSTDGTADIIFDFIKSHEGIENRTFYYIKNKKNSGVCVSRNRAAQKCSGEYLCYLDADDIWDERKVEAQIEQIEIYKKRSEYDNVSMPVIFATGRECINENGEPAGISMHIPKIVHYKDMLRTNYIPCSSVMLERSVAMEFPMERDDMAEDYITWLKIIKKYGPAACIDEPLLKYRLTGAGRSSDKLKTTRMHYKALRYVGTGRLASVKCTISYMIYGLKKYSKKK